MSRSPEFCPVCGHDVPPRSLACPECGADDRSGWREDAGSYDGLDLPDTEFDHADFVKHEFGASLKPAGLSTGWWIVAVLVLLGFLAVYFGLFR